MEFNKVTNVSFNDNLDKGSIAEAVFEQHMNVLEYKFQDVRKDKEYQKIDVDYLVDDMKIEIKADFCFGSYNWEKQRFFMETVQNRRINSAGWMKISECDVLGIYDAINKIMYYMLMEDIKEYINLYSNDTNRMMYIQIKNGAEGWGININAFWDWLINNEKFNFVYRNE